MQKKYTFAELQQQSHQVFQKVSLQVGHQVDKLGKTEVVQKVKAKMDSSGVSSFAVKTGEKLRSTGSIIAQKASVAGTQINQKIEANEKLKGYKTATFKGLEYASKSVNSGFNSLWTKITKKKATASEGDD